MGIVENGVVLAIGLDDLIEGLRNEIGPDAIARHEGQRRLKEIQSPQRRKLVQHQQQLAAR